jgi:hypothetical protein
MNTLAPKPELPRIYAVRVVRVLDGLTLEVDVDLGFHISTRVKGHLYGLMEPTADARKVLEELCLRHTFKSGDRPFLLAKTRKTAKGWSLELQGIDGQHTLNLNDAMVRRGKAESYLP